MVNYLNHLLLTFTSVALIYGCNSPTNKACDTEQIKSLELIEDSLWVSETNHYEKLIVLHKKCGKEMEQVLNTLSLTLALGKLNNEESLKRRDSLLKVVGKLPITTSNKDCKAYYHLCVGLNLKYSDSSFYHFRLAEKSNPNDKILLQVYFTIGRAFLMRSQFDSSKVYHKKTVALAKNLSPSRSFVINRCYLTGLGRLGICHEMLGDLDSALLSLNFCDSIQRHITAPKVTVNNLIGSIHMKMGNMKEAKRYFKTSYYKTKNEPYSHNHIESFIYLWKYYYSLKQYDSLSPLVPELDSAMATSKTLGYFSAIPQLFVLKHQYFSHVNGVHQSQRWADSAILWGKRVNSEFAQFETRNTKIQVYVENEKWENALPLLLQNHSFFSKNDMHSEISETSRLLHQVYKNMGRLDKALPYLESHKLISDSILNEKKVKDLAKYSRKFELKRKEANITRLELNATRHKSDIERRNFIIGITAAFLILLVLFQAYRRKNQRVKHQKELKLKELTMLKEMEVTQNKLSDKFMHQQETYQQELAMLFHDNIGSLLATLKLHFKKLEDKVVPKKKDEPLELEKTATLIQKLQTEVSSTSRKLSSGFIENVGLLAAVDDLCKSINESGIIKVTLHCNLEDSQSIEHQIQLYRIIQEAVGNAIKHANPKHIELSILESEGELLIKVEDDGKGFDMASVSSGLGLQSLKRRAEQIKAILDISSKPSRGTVIHLSLTSGA